MSAMPHHRTLPAHHHPAVLTVLLEALFDYTPALASSVRRQPVAWSATGWKVCPTCNGDERGVKRGKHWSECGRCHGDKGWRIDPYDRQQTAEQAAPIRVLSLPELERACAPLDPVLDDTPMGVTALVAAIDRREPPEDPDVLLDAIELQLRYRSSQPAFRQIEAALIAMRQTHPYHRGVLIRVHVSQWQTLAELSPEDQARHAEAFPILADTLGPMFTAPRWVRERAQELLDQDADRQAIRNAAGRWASVEAKKQRDKLIRRLDDKGWSNRAIARHLGVSDRTVRRILERNGKAA